MASTAEPREEEAEARMFLACYAHVSGMLTEVANGGRQFLKKIFKKGSRKRGSMPYFSYEKNAQYHEEVNPWVANRITQRRLEEFTEEGEK